MSAELVNVLDIPLKCSDAQWEFITSESTYTLLSGGYGAGKSWALAHAVFGECLLNQGLTGMVVADTYGRLYRDFLPRLAEVLEQHDVEYRAIKVVQGGRKVPGWSIGPDWIDHTLLFGSMQNPASLKGPTLSHIGLEECTLLRPTLPGMDETTFSVLNSRLRSPTGTNRIKGSGTPEGLTNWTNRPGMFFVPPDDPEAMAAWRSDFRVIVSSSRDNPANPPEYVARMARTMTPTQIREKIEGVPAAGAVGAAYPDFSRERNVRSVNYDPLRGPIIVGLDFNVQPICAVLMQDTGGPEGSLLVFDEIAIEAAGTFPTHAIAREIVRRCRALGVPPEEVRVYPDASGRSRKTTGESDMQVLRAEGLRRLIYPKRGNPYVSERLNAMNALLYHGRLIVDPRCVGLIADFQQVAINPHGELVKTGNRALTHRSDGCGYVAVQRYPVRGRRAGIAMAA